LVQNYVKDNNEKTEVESLNQNVKNNVDSKSVVNLNKRNKTKTSKKVKRKRIQTFNSSDEEEIDSEEEGMNNIWFCNINN